MDEIIILEEIIKELDDLDIRTDMTMKYDPLPFFFVSKNSNSTADLCVFIREAAVHIKLNWRVQKYRTGLSWRSFELSDPKCLDNVVKFCRGWE